jgi:hypothetical protein
MRGRMKSSNSLANLMSSGSSYRLSALTDEEESPLLSRRNRSMRNR